MSVMLIAKRQAVDSPFTVLVDQQEGKPYSFSGLFADADRGNLPLIVPTRTTHLRTGDYTIDGYADLVCVERKTFADFCGSFGGDRVRELKKLVRMSKMLVAWYVLEFSFSALCGPQPPFSRVNMKSLRRSLMSFTVKYPHVNWLFCDCREYAEATTYRLLEKWWGEMVVRPAKASKRQVSDK